MKSQVTDLMCGVRDVHVGRDRVNSEGISDFGRIRVSIPETYGSHRLCQAVLPVGVFTTVGGFTGCSVRRY
ncbi:hypothetical protein, partial [Streptomyces verrucosisporus]|uniref:hypothetical protein n=1 Tax=Streptomyces verrucosisporus TaxID=1695161 RepID=UPI0019CF8DFB